MMLASPVVLNHWDVLSLSAAPPLRQLLSRPYQTFKNSQSVMVLGAPREGKKRGGPTPVKARTLERTTASPAWARRGMLCSLAK